MEERLPTLPSRCSLVRCFWLPGPVAQQKPSEDPQDDIAELRQAGHNHCIHLKARTPHHDRRAGSACCETRLTLPFTVTSAGSVCCPGFLST